MEACIRGTHEAAELLADLESGHVCRADAVVMAAFAGSGWAVVDVIGHRSCYTLIVGLRSAYDGADRVVNHAGRDRVLAWGERK